MAAFTLKATTLVFDQTPAATKCAQRKQKSFGYLIDISHIWAIYLSSRLLGISACDLFSAFPSDLDFASSALLPTRRHVLLVFCIIPCKPLASVFPSDAIIWFR